MITSHVAESLSPKAGRRDAGPSSPQFNAAILVGGPTAGTRFRPLSLHSPKPLFPVAGKPIILHHLEALAQLGGDLGKVFLIGDFEAGSFEGFLASAVVKRLGLDVRFLCEGMPHGKATGLLKFRSELLAGAPNGVIVLHGDIACGFPLKALLRTAERGGDSVQASMLVTKVPDDDAHKYGTVVLDKESGLVRHWAEKPETLVSNLVNAGVYFFRPGLWDRLAAAAAAVGSTSSAPAAPWEAAFGPSAAQALRLEQDVLMPLAEAGGLAGMVSEQFWVPIKAPADALAASRAYLVEELRQGQREASSSGPKITGRVSVDPSATVDPSASLGPNVTIGAGCKIGPGARIQEAIVLDGAIVDGNAYVARSIIGWGSRVGSWCRVEGSAGDATGPSTVTILAHDVKAHPEIMIRNSLILPHKTLRTSTSNTIIL